MFADKIPFVRPRDSVALYNLRTRSIVALLLSSYSVVYLIIWTFCLTPLIHLSIAVHEYTTKYIEIYISRHNASVTTSSWISSRFPAFSFRRPAHVPESYRRAGFQEADFAYNKRYEPYACQSKISTYLVSPHFTWSQS